MGFELTTLVVIGTDCTASCKSNYHMITTALPFVFGNQIYQPQMLSNCSSLCGAAIVYGLLRGCQPKFSLNNETIFANSGGLKFGHCIVHTIWHHHQQDSLLPLIEVSVSGRMFKHHLLVFRFPSPSEKQHFMRTTDEDVKRNIGNTCYSA